MLCDKSQALESASNLINNKASKAITHQLIYAYDYGDNWKVAITRHEDYNNLVDEGLVDQDWLNEAEQLVKEKHKPICIHQQGSFVMDDVGGLSGFSRFLETIYVSDDKEEKENYKLWAKDMGWHNRKIDLSKML